jgi:hypothetical protein
MGMEALCHMGGTFSHVRKCTPWTVQRVKIQKSRKTKDSEDSGPSLEEIRNFINQFFRSGIKDITQIGSKTGKDGYPCPMGGVLSHVRKYTTPPERDKKEGDALSHVGKCSTLGITTRQNRKKPKDKGGN